VKSTVDKPSTVVHDVPMAGQQEQDEVRLPVPRADASGGTATAVRPTDVPDGIHRADDERVVASAVMSRVPERHRHRGRVAVVTVLSVIVVLTASGPYLLLDPNIADQQIGLRPDVSFHFPILVVHALTAGIALLVGPWQFVRRIRRMPRIHRNLGRTYLFAGVLPASAAGIVLAWLSTAGPWSSLGFAFLDVAWVATAGAGYLAARDRRYRDHERWMIRSFALTFAGVMLRVWMPVLLLLQLALPHDPGVSTDDMLDRAYVFVPWLAWIPNVIVVELYLRRTRAMARR
jgi:hypothetical protein